MRAFGPEMDKYRIFSQRSRKAHPVFESYPELDVFIAPYFWAYLNLKRRASSFGGTITWNDFESFYENQGVGLDKAIFLDVVDVLEDLDNKISKSQQERT